MAKLVVANGDTTLKDAVIGFADQMITVAADRILKGAGKRKGLRDNLSANLAVLRSELVVQISRIFKRDEVSAADVTDAVSLSVNQAARSLDSSLFSKHVKDQLRIFNDRVTELLALPEEEPAPPAANSPAGEITPSLQHETLVQRYTWGDIEARDVFMPEVLNSIVSSEFSVLKTELSTKNPPVISDSEIANGTNIFILSQFLAFLRLWMEKTSMRHFQGQKIAFHQFKKRIGVELTGVTDHIKMLSGSAAMAARPNQPHPDLLPIMNASIARIHGAIAALDEATVFSEPVSSMPIEWDAEQLFLPKTVEFLEERLVSDQYVPHTIEGPALRCLERYAKGRSGALKTSEMKYILDMLNDDFHGDIQRTFDDKTVRVIDQQDVMTALAMIHQREQEENIRMHLPGMFRKAADLHAQAVVASLSSAVETTILAGHPTLTGSLNSGEIVALVSKQWWSEKWQVLAYDTAAAELKKRQQELDNIPHDKIFHAARKVLVDDMASTHGKIVSEFIGRLAPDNPDMPVDIIMQSLSLGFPDTATLEAIHADPTTYGAYVSDPSVHKAAAAPILRGRTTLEEFPLTTFEVTQMETMLRSYGTQNRFDGLTLDEMIEMISAPDELLGVLSNRFNQVYHGGLSFRTIDDLKDAARACIQTLSPNLRKAELEQVCIDDEFAWLFEKNLWPTEREIQRGISRIATDVYDSKNPVMGSNDPVPLQRRRLGLLKQFGHIAPARNLAKQDQHLSVRSDEFDPRLREKLLTECFEVEDWVEKLVREEKPLSTSQLHLLLERVKEVAFQRAQHIWRIQDFNEFVRRQYRRESERVHPEMLQTSAHPLAANPSTYPESSPNWAIERRVIVEKTALLRESSSWPTEREIQRVLFQLQNEVYPEGFPDPEVVRGLRECIIDTFDPELVVSNLAVPRPRRQHGINQPQEVLNMHLPRTRREYDIVLEHIPTLADSVVQKILLDEPDELLARQAVVNLLDHPSPDTPNVELLVNQELYGNRGIWRPEDFREFLIRSIIAEVMILWPEDRKAALSDPEPVSADPSVTADPLLSVDEHSIETTPPSVFLVDVSVESAEERVERFVPSSSEQDSPIAEALPVTEEVIAAPPTPLQQMEVVPPESAFMPASEAEPDSFTAPAISEIVEVPPEALRLQSLLRAQYQKMHEGVPTIDSLMDLEDTIREAANSIRIGLSTLPAQVAALLADHAAVIVACRRKTDISLDDFTKNRRLLRGFLTKMATYETTRISIEKSCVEWPNLYSALRKHRAATSTFLSHRKDLGRMVGVNEEEIPTLLGIIDSNGVDDILNKLEDLDDQYQSFGDLVPDEKIEEYHTDSIRAGLVSDASDTLSKMEDRVRLLLEDDGTDADVLSPTITPVAQVSVASPQLPDTEQMSVPNVLALPEVPECDRMLVHSLLLFAAGGKEAGNNGMGISYSRYRPSCEAIGLRHAARLSFDNPGEETFQTLLRHSVVTLEAQQAIDAWKEGNTDRKSKTFPGGRTSIPPELQDADTLFVCALNSSKFWVFNATEKGRLYAEQCAIQLDSQQLTALAAARTKRAF